ncbi:MAG: LPS export ABC transporter ATP-binding protein [Gemmataceae bacterium]|nr:LPS export ABC transporter ATP-binding protein [Gemmataceae bacterium]
MAILEVRGVVKIYGRRRVVDGVDFDVDRGEVVGLLGPNGAGKTTSFRMTTGQLTPFEGHVFFNGEEVTHLPMYQRARRGMGYLPQEMSIFRKLTVEQNILAILEIMPAMRTLGRRLSRQERWQRTNDVLEQFGLTHVRKNVAARLSGGEKRRLEIARCLVCEPLLILLDEPFAAVDPLTKADIRRMIAEMAKQGIGILLCDHDVREVFKITDRSYLIKDGRVRTHGTPQQLVHDPVAIAEYLGHSFNDNIFGDGPATPPAPPVPAPASPAAEPAVYQVLEQEKIHRLIERLRTDDADAAAEELVQRGPAVVPALFEALERRDVEMRRRAHLVLQRVLGADVAFDAYAPEALRRQQIAQLREGHERKAG